MSDDNLTMKILSSQMCGLNSSITFEIIKREHLEDG